MLSRYWKITLYPTGYYAYRHAYYDNNSPQNLCAFSIRIAEYNARRLNALPHKRHSLGNIDLNIKWVLLTRVASYIIKY